MEIAKRTGQDQWPALAKTDTTFEELRLDGLIGYVDCTLARRQSVAHDRLRHLMEAGQITRETVGVLAKEAFRVVEELEALMAAEKRAWTAQLQAREIVGETRLS